MLTRLLDPVNDENMDEVCSRYLGEPAERFISPMAGSHIFEQLGKSAESSRAPLLP